jgi:hypothetical protein
LGFVRHKALCFDEFETAFWCGILAGHFGEAFWRDDPQHYGTKNNDTGTKEIWYNDDHHYSNQNNNSQYNGYQCKDNENTTLSLMANSTMALIKMTA